MWTQLSWLICVTFLATPAWVAGHKQASTTVESKPMKNEIQFGQADFDAMVEQLAAGGIDDYTAVKSVLGVEWEHTEESVSTQNAEMLEASRSSIKGLERVIYHREIDKEVSVGAVKSALLSIYFSGSPKFTAWKLSEKFQNRVYVLPPSIRALSFFKHGKVWVYLKSDPLRALNGATIDEDEPVREVVMKWTKEPLEPLYPVLYDKNELKR